MVYYASCRHYLGSVVFINLSFYLGGRTQGATDECSLSSLQKSHPADTKEPVHIHNNTWGSIGTEEALTSFPQTYDSATVVCCATILLSLTLIAPSWMLLRNKNRQAGKIHWNHGRQEKANIASLSNEKKAIFLCCSPPSQSPGWSLCHQKQPHFPGSCIPATVLDLRARPRSKSGTINIVYGGMMQLKLQQTWWLLSWQGTHGEYWQNTLDLAATCYNMIYLPA